MYIQFMEEAARCTFKFQFYCSIINNIFCTVLKDQTEVSVFQLFIKECTIKLVFPKIIYKFVEVNKISQIKIDFKIYRNSQKPLTGSGVTHAQKKELSVKKRDSLSLKWD